MLLSGTTINTTRTNVINLKYYFFLKIFNLKKNQQISVSPDKILFFNNFFSLKTVNSSNIFFIKKLKKSVNTISITASLVSGGWNIVGVPLVFIHSAYFCTFSTNKLFKWEFEFFLKKNNLLTIDYYRLLNKKGINVCFSFWTQCQNIESFFFFIVNIKKYKFPLFFYSRARNVSILSFFNWIFSGLTSLYWHQIQYSFFFRLDSKNTTIFLSSLKLLFPSVGLFFFDPKYFVDTIMIAKKYNFGIIGFSYFKFEPWFLDFTILCNAGIPQNQSLFIFKLLIPAFTEDVALLCL